MIRLCDLLERIVDAPVDLLERAVDRLAGIPPAPRSSEPRAVQRRELELRLDLRTSEIRDLRLELERRRGQR